MRINSFGGIAPAVKPHKLPDGAAVVAENCDLRGGGLEPTRRHGEGIKTVGNAKTIYKHGDDWLSWPGRVSVAESHTNDDILITGDGAPVARKISGQACPLSVPKPAAVFDYNLLPFDQNDLNLSYSFRYWWDYMGERYHLSDWVDVPELGDTAYFLDLHYWNVSDPNGDGNAGLGRRFSNIFPSVDNPDQPENFQLIYDDWDALEAAAGYTINTFSAVPQDLHDRAVGDSLIPSIAVKFRVEVRAKDSSDSVIGYATSVSASADNNLFLNAKAPVVDYGKFKLNGNAVYSPSPATVESTALALNVRYYDLIDGEWKPRTVEVSADTAGSSTKTVIYRITGVDAWGRESEPTDPADQDGSALSIDVPVGNGVRISGFPATAGGECGVKSYRIYRLVSTVEGDTYHYVGEVDAPTSGTTTFSDRKLDSQITINETIATEDFNVPPGDMHSITGMPSGFYIGPSGKSVCLSEIGYSYAWPEKYRVNVDYEIVGITAAFENSAVIVTKGNPYLLTAYAPDDVTLTKLDFNQGCVNARTIVDMGSRGVGYVSDEGIVAVLGGSAVVFTEKLYLPEQWRSLDKASMHCRLIDGQLCVFNKDGAIIFDFDEGIRAVTTDDTVATATHVDITGSYVVEDGQVKKWREGEHKTLTWRSGDMLLNRPVEFSSYRIIADEAVELVLYRDGVERFRRTSADGEARRLPVIPRGQRWALSVTTGGEMFEVDLTALVRGA